MRTTTLLLAFTCFIVPVRAQERMPVFGKPLMSELTMKECSFDKNASALKLIDHQEKEIFIDHYDLKIKTEKRVKIKIFNEKGFKYASVSIPYVRRTKASKVTDISAYIHYLDPSGKMITQKLGKKEIFKDKSDETIRKISFTFPNVQAGCVIEYKYEKLEVNTVHFEPWYCQDVIPAVFSQMILKMPSRMGLNRRLIGIDSVSQKTTTLSQGYGYPSTLQVVYWLNNINAFRAEPMMTSVADNLQRVEFAIQAPTSSGPISLLGGHDWNLLAKALNEVSFFGKQFTKPVPGTEAIIDSAKLLKTTDEKINFIFQHVKKQVKWDDQQTFYADDIAAAWKERSGNSADINLLLLNLLRKAGIKCSPLLISTRDNGKLDRGFPSLSQFNGVNILAVSDSNMNYILDGTRPYLSYKATPSNILNRMALKADIDNSGWVNITDNRPLLKSSLSINAELTPEGKLTGMAYIQLFDHSKAERLLEKNTTEEDQRDEERGFLKKDFTELTIDSIITENEENELEPLKEKFKFTYEPSSSEKFLFLDPFFLSSFRKNPFLDSVRHTSIDFGSHQHMKTTVNIELPPSYEVEHIPKSIRLVMADSSIIFERKVYHQGNGILFINTMQVLNPIFEKEQYAGVKDFFNRIYGMIGEQIILKRKD